MSANPLGHVRISIAGRSTDRRCSILRSRWENRKTDSGRSLKPVFVGGVTVSNVSSQQRRVFGKAGVQNRRHRRRPSCRDVIPEVVRVIPELRPADAKDFVMPEFVRSAFLMPIRRRREDRPLPRRFFCKAQRVQAILHFCQPYGVQLTALERNSQNRSSNADLVKTVADIYK